MITLTIRIPDREVQEVSTYIKQKGGKVIKKNSTTTIKQTQLASLKQGLTEAILISRNDVKGTPLSELWDE